MTVVTWPRKPSRIRSTMVPRCKTTRSVRLSVRTLAFHAGKEGFDSPTEHHCFYSQASIRYRVWTHTLFGSQRPATDPDITASALTREHRTSKLAFSVLDYKNMQRWQSGPMHGIANPENRVFKSRPLLQVCSSIAQLVECRTVNPLVPGSSPGRGAKYLGV